MSLIKIGVAALFVCGSATAVRADALLDQIIAGARADKAIAWRVDRINTDMNNSGKADQVSVAHFDGAAASGARWSLVSINGQSATPKASADFSDKFNKSDFAPTYGQLADLLASGATKTGETDKTVRYRIDSLPAHTVVAGGYDLSKALQAEFTVDTSGPSPFVTSVHISAPKPFKPASVGRVDMLDRSMKFARGPQGLPILVESLVKADFKVLFKTMTIRTHTAFQNQLPIQQTAQLGKTAGSR